MDYTHLRPTKHGKCARASKKGPNLDNNAYTIYAVFCLFVWFTFWRRGYAIAFVQMSCCTTSNVLGSKKLHSIAASKAYQKPFFQLSCLHVCFCLLFSFLLIASAHCPCSCSYQSTSSKLFISTFGRRLVMGTNRQLGEASEHLWRISEGTKATQLTHLTKNVHVRPFACLLFWA